MVPEDRGSEAGLDPSAVKVQKSQGGGYLVNVEGLHHLHCLVSLSSKFILAAKVLTMLREHDTPDTTLECRLLP